MLFNRVIFAELIKKDRGKGPMKSWQPNLDGAKSYHS